MNPGTMAKHIAQRASTISQTKRTLLSMPSHSDSQKVKHVTGTLSALVGVTALVVSCTPLEQLEQLDRKNDCFHHHLHPR